MRALEVWPVPPTRTDTVLPSPNALAAAIALIDDPFRTPPSCSTTTSVLAFTPQKIFIRD